MAEEQSSTPVVETPAAEAPVVEAPAAEAPVVEATAAEAPVAEVPAVETPSAPVTLPTYNLGDEGKPEHFDPSTSRDAAAVEAQELAVFDSAFIKRSDLKWTYAVVTERVEPEEGNDSPVILRFEVDKDRNRKSFPQPQWGKYIRVVKCSDEEMAKLKEAQAEIEAEAAAKAAAEAAAKEEAAKITTAASSDASTGGASAKSGKSAKSNKSSKSSKSVKSIKSGGFFGSIFGSKKSEEKAEESKETTEPAAEPVAEEKPAEVAAPVEDAAPKDDISVTEVAGETPSIEASPVEKVEEPQAAPEAAPKTPEEQPEDDTKENSNPIKLAQPATFLPSTPKEDSRAPFSLKPALSFKKKNSLVNKIFKSKGTPKAEDEKKPVVTVTTAGPAVPALADPKSPGAGGKKEWFDPEASEVDYDKNPTDLFQALEARQFDYAEEMYSQVNLQFTKECRTWVVARGQKKKDSSHLRFRALPLHAALVFGATDDMIIKILNAYPKATRGRDVKGRLPIHLAMEHNASEEVVCKILEEFPKGYFAKDKKGMLPSDYINMNMARAHQKRYVPVLCQAKVEEERVRWEAEKAAALEAQKAALKSDPEYMADVISQITEETEAAYSSKMVLLESNYKKEIELLKKKHDSETQALLEGFEVKLNFERKLNKLKAPKAGRGIKA